MLDKFQAFSGFSIKDTKRTKAFYQDELGLQVDDDDMGLYLVTKGNNRIFMYQKDDHQPATFTILNFVVEDIDAVVKDLLAKGVDFEDYDFGGGAKTDDLHIMRGLAAKQGPDIAWIKDPSGNILAVLQEK